MTGLGDKGNWKGGWERHFKQKQTMVVGTGDNGMNNLQ